MSANFQIFVRGGAAESLLSDIMTLLPDAILRPGDHGRQTEFVNDRLLGDVGTHEYDTDDDLNFSDYPLVVDFQGIRNRADYRTIGEEFGQRLFDALRQRGLDLLWVDDLQRRVAEHHQGWQGEASETAL